MVKNQKKTRKCEQEVVKTTNKSRKISVRQAYINNKTPQDIQKNKTSKTKTQTKTKSPSKRRN